MYQENVHCQEHPVIADILSLYNGNDLTIEPLYTLFNKLGLSGQYLIMGISNLIILTFLLQTIDGWGHQLAYYKTCINSKYAMMRKRLTQILSGLTVVQRIKIFMGIFTVFNGKNFTLCSQISYSQACYDKQRRSPNACDTVYIAVLLTFTTLSAINPDLETKFLCICECL